MKAYSITCKTSEIKEVRDMIIGLGANVFKLIQLTELDGSRDPLPLTRIVFTIDEEAQLVFKLAFPAGAIIECSA
jgi:hypothetical protein